MLRAVGQLLWTLAERSHSSRRARRRQRLTLLAAEVRLWSTEQLEDRINLAGPQFDESSYFFSISENAAPGVVGSVSATDADGPDVTYSGGDGPFSVDAQSGAISFVGALDYEAQGWYSFEVTATDPDNNTDTVWVDIEVLDVDDEAPVLDLGVTTFFVSEDAQVDDLVEWVYALDPDTNGDSLTYTITPASAPFRLVVTGWEYDGNGHNSQADLLVDGALDFETQSSYELLVHVEDPAGNFDEATFTVQVTDVNPPPVFDPSSYEFSIPEDAAFGTVVGYVYASDAENEPLTYGLDDGYGGPVQFLITKVNDNTAVITVADELDYESDSFYELTVYVSDPADQFAFAPLPVYVLDIPEGGTGNVPPDAVDDVYYVLPGTLQDTSLSGLPSVLDNDTDLGEDPLTATLDTGPTSGILYALGADGHFTYLAGAAGTTDTFTYIANDGEDDSDPATVTIQVIEVSIKYPHGDPTQSATDWTNKDSDEANIGNEWTFNGGAAAGISTVSIEVEAEITPAAAAIDAADWLRWSIEDVGPIQAEWANHVDGDVHIGKGLITTADFVTLATGLPASNDAFGGKTISLSLPGSGVVDTTDVEIFYPKYAANHPGAGLNAVQADFANTVGADAPRAPNWFYYWSQAVGGAEQARYGGGLGQGQRTPAVDSDVTNCRQSGCKMRVRATPKMVSGCH
jgi:hypothetical protein